MKFLLLNQCFYPDVVSTAQHLTDLAVELSEQGHDVTVIASRRGYDDTELLFPKRETWKGIKIIRLPSLALGKQAKWRRALNFGSFLICCVFRLAVSPKFDVVVALTSPPLISFFGALFARLKGGRFVFWVMDLNPDEAIAAGWLKEGSLVAQGLQRLLSYSLKRAEKILVLDRFMKDRIREKGVSEHQLAVIPPWSHTDAVQYDLEGRLAFRARYGLSDKFVVMYSGNHSPCHPLDTLLQAAERLKDHPQIAFCFIGGGSEYEKVRAFMKERRLTNVLCLPYQPLDKLAASLSAADLHVVVMGEAFKGIIHPCKIYNILAVGAPFLYIGPPESHITDILSRMDFDKAAGAAKHGEVDVVVNHIVGAQRANGNGSKAAISIADNYSKENLLPRMLEVLESARAAASVFDSGSSTTHTHSV